MKSVILTLVLSATLGAHASDIGDAFVELGNSINQSSTIDANKTAKLWDLLSKAKKVSETGSAGEEGGFICANGYLIGPNGYEKWSGDTTACTNPVKVKIAKNFACFIGYLVTRDGREIWSGDQNLCTNPKKLKIGNNYACVIGHIIGPDGYEKWTGNSESCATVDLD